MATRKSSKKSGNSTKRGKKQQKNATTSQQVTGTVFDAIFDYVSPSTLAGVGITVAALTASAMLLRKQKTSTKSKTKQKVTPGGPGGPSALKFTKSAPILASRSTPGDDSKQVNMQQVSRMFEQCLRAPPKDQKLYMEQFYHSIRSWTQDILAAPARTIVVNFLFWYYRIKNSPKQDFTAEQADYIRYWASYELTPKLDWTIWNLQFDFMYSAALMQRSIPHMKQFHKFVVNTKPRPQPSDLQNKKKDNYSLTRLQSSAILGHWDEVKKMGDVVSRLSADLGWRSPKDNYLLNYALRAMDMPQSNPNFGQIYHIVDKLKKLFPIKQTPPARFGKWTVHSYKYRNQDSNTTPIDDNKFVVASQTMRDKKGFYVFYPNTRGVSMARIPKEVKLWGRIAQMMSPMNGLSGCLPMTGTWTETKLYMEMEWTYRIDSHHNRRKHGIFEVEREPFEDTVISRDMFGTPSESKGYIWKGTLQVTISDEKVELTSHNLFGGLPNGNTKNGNENNILSKEENKQNNTKDIIITTKKGDKLKDNRQVIRTESAIYDIELVMETDLGAQLSKSKSSVTTVGNTHHDSVGVNGANPMISRGPPVIPVQPGNANGNGDRQMQQLRAILQQAAQQQQLQQQQQ